ncbi:ZZ-type zinc finger-containing protein 3 [Calliphora vicina]|uniref:ZZ-type zinc finger-containing protein 3 n=1 Tax=Calliphora vicina TaxID=7373 RepID=UPI00325B97D1
MESDGESVAEGNLFYFESDHLALRGNQDYTNMLRTIAVLEAQKIRAQQHIEELALAKKRYLEEPELFLAKIKNNEEIISPNYMTIATIPEIGHYDDMPAEEVKVKEEDNIGGSTDNKSDVQVNRGRVMDDTKPETFNQLWTVEEQKRLEELLIKFPEERIEMHRFNKIAKALGNRTARQVSSRVQKYFQKLHSAGMPIPGRIPKNRRVGHAKSKHYYRPSTFFPSHNVPVHMPEDDFFLHDLHMPAAETSANENVRSNSLDTLSDLKTEPITSEIQQQIVNLLKIIKQEKLNTPEGYNPDPMAAKCESCQFAAVSRLRWRCNTCYCSLNMCADCLVYQLVQHKFDHFSHDVVAETEM